MGLLSITQQMLLTAKYEIDEDGAPGVAETARKVNVKEWNLDNLQWDATTTPACSHMVALSITCVTATPQEIDLTAAPQLAGADDADLSGTQLLTLLLYADPDNADPIEFGPSDTNGYDVWLTDGGAKVTPGGRIQLQDHVASRDAVDATNKILEIAGTDGDILHVLLIFGT